MLRLFLAAMLICASAARAEAAQYWFGANDPVVQADRRVPQPADYMDLFRPDAPWQNAASRLSVFKVSTQLLNRGTDAEIVAVIADLKRRHIALALEIGGLPFSARCGRGSEGYIGPRAIPHVLGRLRDLGGTLAFVDMDEPVWYGHEQTWSNPNKPQIVPCADSIETLAQQAGSTAAAIHAIFPAARIGDIEPINDRVRIRQLVDDIAEFGARFKTLTGQPLAALHLDIGWRTGWQRAIAPLVARMHAQGTRMGPIVNGDGQAGSSAEWVRSARGHLDEFMDVLGTAPDDIEVQSWNTFPATVLPETDPESLTSLLLAAERRVR